MDGPAAPSDRGWCHSFRTCPLLRSPWSSDIPKFESRDVDIGLHRDRFGTPIRSRRRTISRFNGSRFATACQFARPPNGLTGSSQPLETSTSERQASRLPFPLPDVTTTATELLYWWDLPPGMAASLAAPRLGRDCPLDFVGAAIAGRLS